MVSFNDLKLEDLQEDEKVKVVNEENKIEEEDTNELSIAKIIKTLSNVGISENKSVQLVADI